MFDLKMDFELDVNLKLDTKQLMPSRDAGKHRKVSAEGAGQTSFLLVLARSLSLCVYGEFSGPAIDIASIRTETSNS